MFLLALLASMSDNNVLDTYGRAASAVAYSTADKLGLVAHASTVDPVDSYPGNSLESEVLEEEIGTAGSMIDPLLAGEHEEEDGVSDDDSDDMPVGPTALLAETTGAGTPDLEAGTGWRRPVEREDGLLALSLLPRAAIRAPDPDERFISYLPHSGFHNQRIALANAMSLALYLNRTLLLPPILAGWPITRKKYDALQHNWHKTVQRLPRSFNISTHESGSTFKAADYPSTASDFPLPLSLNDRMAKLTKRADEELTPSQCKAHMVGCRKFAHDTIIAWDSVIDLPAIIEETGLRTLDRFDMREKSVLHLVNVSSSDVLVIKDERAMDFLFSSDLTEEAPLISAPQDSPGQPRVVSLLKMAQLEQKVLLLGTLHSTGKLVWAPDEQPTYDYDFFSKRMVFKNPIVVDAARDIATRLGGPDAYAALHARVTERQFAASAEDHMTAAWNTLVSRLGIEKPAVRQMQAYIDSKVESPRKGERAFVKPVESRSASSGQGNKRAGRRRSLRDLECHGSFHVELDFERFNTPLYLATDSPAPSEEPSLQRFYKAFPCIFTLADFERARDEYPMPALRAIRRLVNVNDGVRFDKRWISQVEATTVAMASVVAGTPGSTFSGFAVHELHDYYHPKL